MRTLLATLLAAATLLLAAAGPAAADGRRSHDRDLTVAAYNIHYGADVDERLDLERIAREIERGGADVIGLQEVDRHWAERSAFEDQARRLAKRLRMHYVYGANLDLEPPAAGQPRRQYGTAVLSAHPIRESRNTLLPRPRGGEQRGLLEAVIDVRGVRMRFATTHLQHNNAEERLAQSQRIAELLALAPEPTVFVGDLNARPGDPELAPLLARLPRRVGARRRGARQHVSRGGARQPDRLRARDARYRGRRRRGALLARLRPPAADRRDRGREPAREVDPRLRRPGPPRRPRAHDREHAAGIRQGARDRRDDARARRADHRGRLGRRHARPPGVGEQVPRHRARVPRRSRVPLRTRQRRRPRARSGQDARVRQAAPRAPATGGRRRRAHAAPARRLRARRLLPGG